MENTGKELAQAYMAAYDEALNHSFGNEQYAMNVATAVVFVLAQNMKQQQESVRFNTLFSGLFGFEEDAKNEPKKGRRKNNGRKENTDSDNE